MLCRSSIHHEALVAGLVLNTYRCLPEKLKCSGVALCDVRSGNDPFSRLPKKLSRIDCTSTDPSDMADLFIQHSERQGKHHLLGQCCGTGHPPLPGPVQP